MSRALLIKSRMETISRLKKITSAMKLVAMNRLNKIEVRAKSFAVYREALNSYVKRVASSRGEDAAGVFLKKGKTSNPKRLLIAVVSEKGLCGGFNINILNKVESFFESKGIIKNSKIITLGKRGAEILRKRGYESSEIHSIALKDKIENIAKDLLEKAVNSYLSGEVDEICVAYNEFKSLVSHKSVVYKLLPVALDDKVTQVDCIFDGEAESIMKKLIAEYVYTNILNAILSSKTSEESARMFAMDNATKNADEMADNLTRAYHKVRQSVITREILEIAQGAEAAG